MPRCAGTFIRRDPAREIWRIIVLAVDSVTFLGTTVLVALTTIDAAITFIRAVLYGPDVEASLLPRMFLDNFGAEGIWLWWAGLVSVYIAIELTTLFVAKVLGQLAGKETGKIVNFLRVIFLRPIWFCVTFVIILMHHTLMANMISTIGLLIDSP